MGFAYDNHRRQIVMYGGVASNNNRLTIRGFVAVPVEFREEMVSASANFAITSTNTVYSWGNNQIPNSNTAGLLGFEEENPATLTPQRIDGF